MTVETEQVVHQATNVQVGVNIDVPFPMFDKAHVVVVYGRAGNATVQDVDYTATLNPPEYADFVVTPLQPLRDKIDAMLAADPTEADLVTISRDMPLTTDMDETLALYREQISLEFDRTILRMQQIARDAERGIKVAATTDPAFGTTVVPEDGKIIGFDADGVRLYSADDYPNIPNDLSDLSDADTSGAVALDALTFDGTVWVPGAVPRGLNDLSDVDTGAAAEDDWLTYKGGVWLPTAVPPTGLQAVEDDPAPAINPAAPGLNMNGKPLIDGGGAQLIGFSSSATPVNSLQVLNADAGNRAVMRAIGEAEAQLGLASQGAQRVWARRANGLYYPLITDLDAPFVLQGYITNTAGGTLEWRPLGGGRVWINAKGNVEFGTVSASITPVAWTLYYVYGYLSGGTTPALEITTTGPTTIADPPGIYFKAGDSTRTLLAVARANGNGQFEFSTQNQMIRNMSGFPPIATRARGNDGYDVSSTGLTLISIATLKTDVVLAPGDVLVVRAEGTMNSPYGYVLFCGPTIDTASASHTGSTVGTLAGGWTGETYSGISGVAWLKASGWQAHTGYLQAMVTGGTGRIGSEHIGAAEAPTLTAEVHPNGY